LFTDHFQIFKSSHFQIGNLIFAVMDGQSLFKHETPLQLRFADLDALNHVNNANYLTYMELARILYLEQVLDMKMDERYSVILAKATVEYRRPIHLGDDVKVYTRCSRIGNKSFDLEYELRKTEPNGNKTVMAVGHTVMVAYDYDTSLPISVPDAWRQHLVVFDSPSSVDK
jgi:acyl-CoA thioester hydrolase